MCMGETIYRYLRVSTQEQNEACQITAMRKFGVTEDVLVVSAWAEL